MQMVKFLLIVLIMGTANASNQASEQVLQAARLEIMSISPNLLQELESEEAQGLVEAVALGDETAEALVESAEAYVSMSKGDRKREVKAFKRAAKSVAKDIKDKKFATQSELDDYVQASFKAAGVGIGMKVKCEASNGEGAQLFLGFSLYEDCSKTTSLTTNPTSRNTKLQTSFIGLGLGAGVQMQSSMTSLCLFDMGVDKISNVNFGLRFMADLVAGVHTSLTAGMNGVCLSYGNSYFSVGLGLYAGALIFKK